MNPKKTYKISQGIEIIGLMGILAQFGFAILYFFRINFMEVLSPTEQASLLIEAIFGVLLTPLFWILALIAFIAYRKEKKYEDLIPAKELEKIKEKSVFHKSNNNNPT